MYDTLLKQLYLGYFSNFIRTTLFKQYFILIKLNEQVKLLFFKICEEYLNVKVERMNTNRCKYHFIHNNFIHEYYIFSNIFQFVLFSNNY